MTDPRDFNDPDDDLPSGPELEALEAEVPVLARFRAFADAADRLPWFAHLGEAMDADTRALARSYLDGLGFPDAEVAPLVDWEDAAAAARSDDWNAAGWEAEEQLRAGLAADALDLISEEALTVALTDLSARLQDTVRGAVEEAASIWDEEDEALLTAAVGAAIQAAHGAALATAVGGEPDHPLMLKYRLFAAGRWPVGLAGLSFNLF